MEPYKRVTGHFGQKYSIEKERFGCLRKVRSCYVFECARAPLANEIGLTFEMEYFIGKLNSSRTSLSPGHNVKLAVYRNETSVLDQTYIE